MANNIIPLIPINLSPDQIQLFDTFLQYGDLEKAKIIFMGREEGLGGDYLSGFNDNKKYSLAIKARYELFTNDLFKDHRVYINTKDYKEGWYINDSKCLKRALYLAMEKEYIYEDIKEPDVIALQARFYWLLQGDNRRSGYDSRKDQNFSICPDLHTKDHAAMIDYFPLPNLNVKKFPYQNYKNRTDYEEKYLNINSKTARFKILKQIYDRYPMEITIAYTGVDKGFRLYRFFQSLGFRFGDPLYTDNVNQRFAGYINPTPSDQRNEFIIGIHKEKKQKVILTPFLSTQYTIKQNDVDVISSWI